ncbi:MAG TPA: hypothetical protein VFU37_13640 [Pyrinomonadaceae bacterium]|nr:hypothetical protein [Pyrinomonadaceae bacterium]
MDGKNIFRSEAVYVLRDYGEVSELADFNRAFRLLFKLSVGRLLAGKVCHDEVTSAKCLDD